MRTRAGRACLQSGYGEPLSFAALRGPSAFCLLPFAFCLGCYFPIAYQDRSVLKYHRPSTNAGDASTLSSRLFTCSSSKTGPAFSTNVSPSSLVKNTLPSTATGEAEKPSRRATPSRPCHSALPLVASNDVTMLAMSFTM